MQAKVVFLHIPKTAGTSFREALSTQFQPDKVCPERHDGLNQWRQVDLEKFDFFAGHFTYSTIAKIPGEKKILTFLRKPSDRIISFYYFCKWHTREYIEKYAVNMLPAKNATLAEYLSGGEGLVSMTEFLGDGNLERALQRLETLSAIGLTERMEESSKSIARRLGLEPVKEMPRLMTTEDFKPGVSRDSVPLYESLPPTREPITAAIASLIAEVTATDQKVYERASELFERQLADDRVRWGE